VALARSSDSACSATLGFVNLIISGERPRSGGFRTLFNSLLSDLQKSWTAVVGSPPSAMRGAA
jgi:hypothetical protein